MEEQTFDWDRKPKTLKSNLMVHMDSTYRNTLQGTITSPFVLITVSSMVKTENDHSGQGKHDLDIHQDKQQCTISRH